jgi:hypothetical protein
MTDLGVFAERFKILFENQLSRSKIAIEITRNGQNTLSGPMTQICVISDARFLTPKSHPLNWIVHILIPLPGRLAHVSL